MLPSATSSLPLALFRRSNARHFFAPAPLQSFYPTNQQFHPEGKDCGAPRPFQGMDPKKIASHTYISHKVTRVPMSTGYQYLHFTTPSVHAPTHGDISVFFDTEDCFKKYSVTELMRGAWPQLRFLLMSLGCILIPVTPLLGVIFYKQKFEPVEQTMDPEEFWKNFKWNYYGGELDHHAYDQYLEARRAKKWRDPEIDPDAYIPSKYRGL